MKKYQNFLSENFHFLVEKFSVYLSRHVFVMVYNISTRRNKVLLEWILKGMTLENNEHTYKTEKAGLKISWPDELVSTN